MSDFFKGISEAVNSNFKDIGKSMDREFKKMGQHTIENIRDDGKQISKGIDNGGWMGGLANTFDVLSPGHLTAEMLDDADVIPHDHNIKQLVAGGVNMAFGAAVPGVGVLYQLDAIAEGFDGISGMMKGAGAPGQSGAAKPNAPQSATPPSEQVSKHDAILAAKHEVIRERAVEQAKALSHAKRAGFEAGFEAGLEAAHGKGRWNIDMERHPGGGFAIDPGFGRGSVNRSYGDNQRALDEMFGKDKTDKANDKLEQILNNPNLSFEDMIFELMMFLMKDGQGDVKNLTDDLRKDQKAQQADIDTTQGSIDALRAKGKTADDPEMAQLLDKRAHLQEARAESRAEIGEKIKNATDKLAEMQQALSNTLNSMHESAMSAIRNIK